MSCCYESRHPQDDGMTAVHCLVPALDNNQEHTQVGRGNTILVEFIRPSLQGQHSSIRHVKCFPERVFWYKIWTWTSAVSLGIEQCQFCSVLLFCSLFFSHQFKVKNFNKWSHEQNIEDINLPAVKTEWNIHSTVLLQENSSISCIINAANCIK